MTNEAAERVERESAGVADGGHDARERILSLAAGEGFAPVRIADAAPLVAAQETALQRLSEGRLDGMGWITAEWIERSTRPARFLESAQSVVLVGLPYHSEEPPGGDDGAARGRIARYARGRDYHRVFEKKLRRLARTVREEFGADARATVDYGPLLERSFAAAAGMGWLGKSTMMLSPGAGPWTLLGAIATSLPLVADEPLRKTCGTCKRCLVACPTGALSPEGHLLDARLCISYHTIENRGLIPRELRAKFGDWIFGCDACLDSCPVGAKHFDSYPEFAPASIEEARPVLAQLLSLDEEAFAERYRGRPIMRAKRDGFVRNVCVALGNVGSEADLPALMGAMGDGSALVRAHAAWGVAQLVRRVGLAPETAIEALRARAKAETDTDVREELALALDSLGDAGAGNAQPSA